MASFQCFIFVLTLIVANVLAQPKLDPAEVMAMKEIGVKMGLQNWDFSRDPCTSQGNWSFEGGPASEEIQSSVACSCSNTTCHLTTIVLKGQNITGPIPAEFCRFSHLKSLDLSRNLLSGSVPSQWANMSLVDLSLMGNLLSGPFPLVLTHITTLQNLTIEGNLFRGPMPQEIGNLVNLTTLIVSSNSFTGVLPEALTLLTNLSDVRISDNLFSGKFPALISKWTQIKTLHIQGCLFEGPIPRNVFAFANLSDLRISDLGGNISEFPIFFLTESMTTLILRRCLINDTIPHSINKMENLVTLDLSYNNLIGGIPDPWSKLAELDFLYLSGNKLIGPIPHWVRERNKNVDVSCNTFTWESESLAPVECPQGNINLVESYLPETDEMKQAHPCLEVNFPCAASSDQYHRSLHINCGGQALTTDDNTTFEADLERRGASTFFLRPNWALSSSGHFMDNAAHSDRYTQTNRSTVGNVSANESALYKTARASPTSLTYYGLCLMRGTYTVKLHFAEIIFTNDSTFCSLGKRLFDVYIQEELVLKDFNIAKEAGGPSKAIIKNFTSEVKNHTLKIQLYWAGKGSTGIPVRGNYGPLISAISIVANFSPPKAHKMKAAGMVVGIVTVTLFFLAVIALTILWKKGCFQRKQPEEFELSNINYPKAFTLREIEAATGDFDAANKIGEGGFGSVYMGMLSDGTTIAVKQLSFESMQGMREFINEVGVISAVQHPNLVKLHGCCSEGWQHLLIYEYMENNCLSCALFGDRGRGKLKLDWPTREKICLEVAKGLAHLHEELEVKIVHRDLKPSNVLLDRDLNAKISDFGFAMLFESEKSHVSTGAVGTIGYTAPECMTRGQVSIKSDVYSFGIIVLEVVCGRKSTTIELCDGVDNLHDWLINLRREGRLSEVIDSKLGSEYSADIHMMLQVAASCIRPIPSERPLMSEVIRTLEGRRTVDFLPSSEAGLSGTKDIHHGSTTAPPGTEIEEIMSS